MAHEQDSVLNEGVVSSFNPDDLNQISSRLHTDQDVPSPQLRTTSEQA